MKSISFKFLMKFNLLGFICFCFSVYTSVSYLRNLCIIQSSTFASKKFIVLEFRSKSIVHFKLNFVYKREK